MYAIDLEYMIYKYYLRTFRDKHYDISNKNLDVKIIGKENAVLFNILKIPNKNIDKEREYWYIFLLYMPKGMLSTINTDNWIDSILIYFQHENDINKLHHLIGMIPYNNNDKLHKEIKKLTYKEENL